jgi:hypothetical protein
MYFNSFEVANQEMIPVSRSLGRIGWLSGFKEFYPCHYQGQIVFEDADQDLIKAIGEQGDYELWKQTALKLRENSISRAMLNAAAASVLLEPLKLRIFILHSWFSSRSGKTVALKFALSFWGDPMKMIGNFNSTAVGLERRAGMLKHLPLGIDELQQMARNLTPAMAVYQLATCIVLTHHVVFFDSCEAWWLCLCSRKAGHHVFFCDSGIHETENFLFHGFLIEAFDNHHISIL